jgi:hypothetical protein
MSAKHPALRHTCGSGGKSIGYSGAPLPRKLGFKEGCTVLLINPPEEYEQLVRPLPPGVRFVARVDRSVDIAHMCVTQRTVLHKQLSTLRKTLNEEAPIWVSWPKQASKRPTDVTEDTIREVALPLGFVDIKVCAVSEVWSGLKVVVRKENRTKP